MPLARPYSLSFAHLEALDVVWVWLAFDQGPPGVGEAVALPGYGDETADAVAHEVGALLDDAVGPADALDRASAALVKRAPFAASAVRTALQLPTLLASSAPTEIPLTMAPATLPDAAAAVEAGYRHLKLKVGANLEADLERALDALGLDARCAFDANQGYGVAEALRFADAIADHPRLQWFEQPVDRRDWSAMARICRHRVPVLLDEPIHDAASVRRATDIGAAGVKLKLCKIGGPRDLLAIAGAAEGLKCVQGNGVATDIGNLPELLLAGTGGFEAPCEAVGFARLEAPLLFELKVRGGCAVLPTETEIFAALEAAPDRLESMK